jgi:hypothetical protein
MTAQRPNVIVSQDFAELTVTPDTPDLEVLIVGPAYQILDYLDDKDDCYGADYGAEDQNWVDWVATPPTDVVLSSPPNVKPGALLDSTSVKIFLDDLKAVLVQHSAAAQDCTFWAADNLFVADDGTSYTGTHFGSVGVQAGDILLAQATATADEKRTVKELAYTLTDILGGGDTILGFDVSGVIAGDIIEIFDDAAATPRNGSYTVKQAYVLGGVVQGVTIEIEDAGNLSGLAGLCNLRVSSPAGVIKINSVDGTGCTGAGGLINLQDWCNLRGTSEFTVASDAVKVAWRVERKLDDEELSATDFSIAGNQITILAGIQVAIAGLVGNKDVSYGEIYVEYIALRTDLQDINTLESNTQILSELGKFDARNPLCVGATVAKANTTTTVKIFGIGSDDVTGYRNVLDAISTVREIYVIVPLTYSRTILGEYLNMANSLADPTYVLAHGLKQKFRVVIGALELQTWKRMQTESSGASTYVRPGSQTNTEILALTFTHNPVDPSADFVATDIIPGDLLTIITWDGFIPVTYGPFTVAHINSATELEIDIAGTAFPTGGAPPAYDDWTVAYTTTNGAENFLITDSTGLITKIDVTFGIAPCVDFTLLSAALDQLYLDIEDLTATFISDLLIPGDIVQIPQNPDLDSDWTNNIQAWTVDTVVSETRLRIVNNGNNTPGTTHELPHGVSRSAVGVPPVTELIVNGTLVYRVIRNLDKTNQVTEMITVAQGYASRRLVTTYPSSLDIAGLVDGSLERAVTTTPAAAIAQPGYYGACVVGGQTAGQPPQQGFTNLPINGIDRVYFSNEYFNEEQLSDLSNGGVYVFVQDNPSAFPYCIHELTTDVSALETGEYMITKDFDFIAWTFLDTMWPFIGTWNITTETMGFIRQALAQIIANLKGQYVRKIGAPLIDASITEVDVSELSKDRIDAYIEVDLPMVLNTIAMHLVAS